MYSYLTKRFILMLLSLVIMSFTAFVLIELPPGDYLSMYIRQLELNGEKVDEARIKTLELQYGYNQPFIVKYTKWISGIVLRGDFGQSFAWNKPVNKLLAERLPFTIVLSLCTILFTYMIAIPIGIYSATHQYSVGDYAATVFGFAGIATPSFLLALVVMYVLFNTFGVSPGGLFSIGFESAQWSFAKVWDLLKHLVVPVVVLGMAGTAGLIRTVRATLLDELNKDYVDTARVKGLTETRLLLKYPVRIALNPIWSSIGWLLPSIVSGATIVSVVINLPTVGPLLLTALQSQDMYLAGSIVLILTFLTLVGTFISDILLVISDPRIRYD
ncbi:MAG: ABC transporter permease [Spirochaetales bacterium]|jgi:peptide/nickel transport system permease protein|nr:ABC transporter permease [Spirochaetales bacterium]